jgi:hypothetical protein
MVNHCNGSKRDLTTLNDDKNLLQIDAAENQLLLSDSELTIIYDNLITYPLGRIKIERILTKNNGNIEVIGDIKDVNIKNIKIIYRSLFDFASIPYKNTAKLKGIMLHIFIVNIITRYDIEEINKILEKENISNCTIHIGSYLKCYDMPLHLIKRINTQIIGANIKALNIIFASTPFIGQTIDDLITNQLSVIDVYGEDNLMYLSYENTLIADKNLIRNAKILCGSSFTYSPNKDNFTEGEQKEKNSISSKDLRSKFIKNEPLPLWVASDKSDKFVKSGSYMSYSPSVYIICGYDMSSNMLIANILKQTLIEFKSGDVKIIDGQFMVERLSEVNKGIDKPIYQVLKICERNIFSRNDVILVLKYDDGNNKVIDEQDDVLMFKSIVTLKNNTETGGVTLKIDNQGSTKNTQNSIINLITMKALAENIFN